MRIVLTCEKCGATAEVHRTQNGATVRFDHYCAEGPGHASWAHPPYEKGPIHVNRGRPDAPY